jgi:hypothetical protein
MWLSGIYGMVFLFMVLPFIMLSCAIASTMRSAQRGATVIPIIRKPFKG